MCSNGGKISHIKVSRKVEIQKLQPVAQKHRES